MYIVTGGAGFIGSALIWGLNRMGVDNILVVDHLGDTDKWKNLNPLRFYDYMEKDVFRTRIATGGFDPIDAIFHLGACSSTTETDASYLIDNNFNFTKELAKFAVSRELRFIYASSAATYGDGDQGYSDNFSKLDDLRPLNAYGYSKHLFDRWAKHNGMFNLIVGLKFTNIFGPNEYHKADMRSVVNRAYHQVVETGKVKLFRSHRPEFADGEQKRDFLYIKDAVKMILFFLDRFDSGLFNIGSGEAETWNKLAAALFKAMGREPTIEYIDMPEHLRGRYQYYTKADMSRLRSIGYEAANTPLEDAARDYVVDYLQPGRHLGDEKV